MIPRYIRSGIAGGLSSLVLLGLAGYGGYRLYTDHNMPYRLESDSGQHYLVEKLSEKRKAITKSFELGTLEERMRGIIQEPKDKVWEAIEKLRK
jgi:hypothetical protein